MRILAAFLAIALGAMAIHCSSGSTSSEVDGGGALSDSATTVGLPPGSACEKDGKESVALCASNPEFLCRGCVKVPSMTHYTCVYPCLQDEHCPDGKKCTRSEVGGGFSWGGCNAIPGGDFPGFCEL